MQTEARRRGLKWLERIEASEKRDADWIRSAEDSERVYSCSEEITPGRQYDFNIHHSNIETILPAVINSTPAPDIRERYRTGATDDETSAARLAGQVIERAILYLIDDGRLDTEAEEMSLDGIMAGRGLIRLRFDADDVPPKTAIVLGEEVEVAPAGVTNETVIFEAVAWRDYREGPATRWSGVPWTAYRHCVPQEEVDRLTDPALREMLAASKADEAPSGEADEDIELWEVWDKASRTVLMVTQDGDIISEQDDPMGLSGFFPSIKPIQPLKLVGKRTPICPFNAYKKQAEEVDRLTKRINKIIAGIKVKAVAISGSNDIVRWAEADDNSITYINELEGLAQTGGLANALEWWPVEQAIAVLKELYASRDAAKMTIYEITGISDIVRGQGAASETATAQQIKTQWGSLRIKKLQRLIERAIRDVFVMTAEIICSKFSIATLQKMTGIRIDGPVAEILSQPLDGYRIDVESDSTVRADLTVKKGEMSEFLQGTANFFATMAPVLEQAPEMKAPVAELYASFARVFSLGKQAEDAIEKMGEMARQPREEGPSPEQQALMAEMQKFQAQMQAEAQKFQGEMALKFETLQLQRDKLAIDTEKAAVDLEIRKDDQILKERELELQGVMGVAELQLEEDQQRAAKIGND